MLKLPAALMPALVLFAGGTHAQSVDWSRYQSGRSPVGYYEGTGSNSEQWTGRSYTVGHTTYFDAYGPNGQTKHCMSYKLGLSTYTDCPLPPLVLATAASAGLHPTKHEGAGARRVRVDQHKDRHLAGGRHAGAAQKVKATAVAGAPR